MFAQRLAVSPLHRSREAFHTAMIQDLIHISRDKGTKCGERARLVKSAVRKQIQTFLNEGDHLIAADSCRTVIFHLIFGADQADRIPKGRKPCPHIIQMSFISFNCEIRVRKLVLIDFEKARLGPVYQDFIKLFYQDFKLNLDLIAAFLRGYSNKNSDYELSDLTKQYLIFTTAIGIFNYTEKIEDLPFKQIGEKMLETLRDGL